MDLSDCFKNCTHLTALPAGFFSDIPTIWMQHDPVKEHIKLDKNAINKHRCPNCGATKLIQNDCEYCGT